MTLTVRISPDPDHKAEGYLLPVIGRDAGPLKSHLPPAVFKAVKAFAEDEDGPFDGKNGSCHSFSVNEKDRLVWYTVFGLAPAKDMTTLKAEEAGGKAYSHISALKVKPVSLVAPHLEPQTAAAIANGAWLKSYAFKKYKTAAKDKKPNGMSLHVYSRDKGKTEKSFKTMKTVSESVFAARDLVSEPPNTLYPESYAAQIKALFRGTTAKVIVLDDKKLLKMGAGAIMAVGQGSARPPRIVVMVYDGRKKKAKKDKPVALIGKGVTFDTGGYCLKPGKGMDDMKFDMGGSAAVIGAMHALAATKADVYVVAAVALAENMISGNAYRPSDIVTSLSGQTIEIINTDAEGRLCLADAMTYIQDTYDPRIMVGAATLTGACMVALGLDIAGLFSNDDTLSNAIREAGDFTGDSYWPMPVNEDFDKQLDSPAADMRNLATSPYGGASTAAAFLKRFVTKDRPWAHLDIAGTAWLKADKPFCPTGASGFGVRSLYHLVTRYHD